MKTNKIKTCPCYKYCGGCNLQGLSYTEQLKKKQDYIEGLLKKFHKVNKIIGMDNPYNYRNKAQVTFGLNEKREVVCGNFVPSTHIIVENNDCMIIDELANKIIETVKKLAIKYKISIFDEVSLKGCLRHVQIRCTNLNEYMVILVVGTNYIPKADLLVKELTKEYKEIKTIVQNINRKHTSMVLGDRNIVLYGKGYINDILCGLKFKLSANSFYQVNKRQTEVLYNTALSLANFNSSDCIIDSYCGIGTIGLVSSKRVKSVIGVEINKQAIKDAVTNAKINKVNNIRFLADDAGHFMSRLSKTKEKIDGVIMDPPRSGADNKFLNNLLKLKPKKVLYISCGPESLRNNLKYLIKNNYKIEVIQPVDMFPFTNHVETIVVLNKI